MKSSQISFKKIVSKIKKEIPKLGEPSLLSKMDCRYLLFESENNKIEVLWDVVASPLDVATVTLSNAELKFRTWAVQHNFGIGMEFISFHTANSVEELIEHLKISLVRALEAKERLI